jgi:hypothetical protein
MRIIGIPFFQPLVLHLLVELRNTKKGEVEFIRIILPSPIIRKDTQRLSMDTLNQ